jgi:acyl carrier protein
MTIDEVKMVVALQLGLKDVRPADRIVEDLGAESADVVNIVAALEDKYRITVDEPELQYVGTVSDLHELVQRHL